MPVLALVGTGEGISGMGERTVDVSRDSEHEPVREHLAQDLLDRLTPLMSALGLLFLLVVIGERMATPGTAMHLAMTVTGWLLWAAFVAEFIARLSVVEQRGRFLRRNWWQVIFLVLPFLRVLRLMRSLRLLRTGRVLSSTVRSSRSAGRLLSDRVAWLGMVTVIVVVAAGELLYEFDRPAESFALTLHATALMAISGEPTGATSAYGKLVELLLALYAVTVFASLAGAFGAYFMGDRMRTPPSTPPDEEGWQ